jgi:hypothetical protein
VDNNDLTAFVTYSTAAAGFLCLVIGLLLLGTEAYLKVKTAKQGKAHVDQALAAGVLPGGAVSDVLDSVAKLAAALKDLTAGTQALVVSVAFFAVSGVAAGAGAVAAAVAT